MTEAIKPHPISLQQVFFVRSVVVATPNHQPDPKALAAGPENSISVNKDPEQKNLYQAQMRCIMNASLDVALPYSIDMECIAQLTTDGSLSEEEAARGVYITAHSVLYGAIREAVLWITSRQPYGPLQLGLSVLQSATPPKSATK